MRMILKTIAMENFKKFGKEVVFTFDEGGNVVRGENGVGKSTIADAFFWLFDNRNYALKDNPPVRNNDTEDADIVRVAITADIDGKPITIQKSQKMKVGTGYQGETTISLTNSYEINSVEYSARDYVKKLNEYGLDMERFLQFSHPDMFVSGMNDKKSRDGMRNTLFAMGSLYTDKKIAEMCGDETKDVCELFDNYTYEEIEKMQKSTMRKISENYGIRGEILDAEIRGMSESKTETDTSALENKKNELTGQIAELDRQIANSAVDLSGYQTELSKVNAEISNIEGEWKQEMHKTRMACQDQLSQTELNLRKVKSDKQNDEQIIKRNDAEMKSLAEDIRKASAKMQSVKESSFDDSKWVFDESTTICSLCGQKLPEDKIDELKTEFATKKEKAQADFKADKDRQIEKIQAEGKDATNRYKELESQNKELSEKIGTYDNQIAYYEGEIQGIHERMDDIPSVFDGTDNKEYQELLTRKDKIETDMIKVEAGKIDTTEIEVKRDKLKAELEGILADLGKVQANMDIDKAIEEKVAKKREYEQMKANCEKILHQLSIISMKKNEMLEESVNSHFKIVKWQLFEQQKNGEYKDACIPTVDGFRFGTSTNTGREVLAKLDIVAGLQDYFDQHYPVFLDGAECLSEITMDRIDIDTQLIMLNVSEDAELRFE